MNSFHWQGQPSIFVTDPKFAAAAKSGKTQSQISTESASRYAEKTGRSLGTVTGISDKSDREAEARAFMRRKG